VDSVIRTRQDAMAAVEVYSPADHQFNRRRRGIGLVAGPMVFVALLFWPLGLSPSSQRLAAVMGLMLIFWVTETLPVAMTSLLGPALVVLLRVAPANTVFAPFADPIVFLFIGSFILAAAMRLHGLDRRIAYTVLAWPSVAQSPGRLLVAYGAVCAGISMWVSNTATAAMLFPIGLSIVTHVSRSERRSTPGVRQFSIAMMLMTAFAASVGGLATPVGTPTNLIGLGMLRTLAGIDISFANWMTLGVPTALVLFGVLAVWFWFIGGRAVPSSPTATTHVRDEHADLGPFSAGERNVVIACGLAIVLWVLPGVLALVGADTTPFGKAYGVALPESVAALLCAILLFVLPVDRRAGRFTMSWEDAARIDWGTILLFGGGVSIGALAYSTGLATSIGRGLTAWLPVHSGLAYTALFTGLAVLLSETTSNTVAATMLVPVAIAAAQAGGVRPIEPALGATLGASLGFMLPISTPPNAIVYGSGHVASGAMMKHGILLDVVGWVIIVLAVSLLGPRLF
jgi:solute carrier family 13 (sodium-dependent dicarboxylate transporter), member 2/3/5